MNKLVEISLIEYPPQLVEHQAQHMLESFTRNVEQQGLQLGQYLRLIGKEQDAFEQEIRTEAESRVRRSLALDAFADAEQIGVEQNEVEDEVRRAAESSDDAEAVQQLAMANPSTRQRVEEVTRERKALARLIELATSGNGKATTSSTSSKRKRGETPAAAAEPEAAAAAEKTTAAAETPDTESQTLDAPASVVEQEPETA
jgi:trigger factor